MSIALMEVKMHATERDRVILTLLEEEGFVSFRELSRRLSASPATLRRDLERLQTLGKLTRVRGGVQTAAGTDRIGGFHLKGVPFHENINRNRQAKEAIGKAAAELCRQGEAIIIDGGSTTLQMCPHLEPLKLQVLTNSLHIVGALLQHQNTGVSIPGGVVFREQNIVLDPFEEVNTRGFHASRMFVGAAAVTRYGLMQSDIILVQAERKLLKQVDELVALVDSSKFAASAGHVLCDLSRVGTLITDSRIDDASAKMVERSGVKLIIVNV
jgi:DeoR family transcriptional regulator, ulaG and ulaABCDEF operon transcriptional repressor